MPDYNQIVEELLKQKHVGRAAESLGLGERWLYRRMSKQGLKLKAMLRWPSLPKSPAPKGLPVESPTESSPVPAAATPRPERNILRLSAADFIGAYCGDAGRPSFTGADGLLLDRYRRLKGY